MGDKLAKVDTFKALTVYEEEDSPFSRDELGDSMGASGFGPGDLSRIKVPAGGGITWEIEEASGVETCKYLDVVIIAAQDVRAFYNTKYSGGNEPPDCVSLDGKTGVPGEDAPEECGGSCETCPKSQWGTAVDENGNQTAGQACSQRKVMLLLQPQATLPIILSAPPTSLKNIQKYFGRLVSGHSRPYWGVVTRIVLEKAQSGGNISYSVMKPEFLRDLTDEEVEAVRQQRALFAPSLSSRAPVGADVE